MDTIFRGEESWVITQRVVVIFLPTFRDSLWIPSSGVKNPGLLRRVVVISYRRFGTAYPVFRGEESWVITLVVVIFTNVSGRPMDTIFRGQESWVITLRVVVISYRRFGTAYQCGLQGWRILGYYASSGNFYRRFGTAYGYHLQGSRILGYYAESSGNFLPTFPTYR